MAYALESTGESERLERQSLSPFYDFRKELAELRAGSGDLLVDAGCGSGVVSRYLAERFPDARIVGCDASEQRIGQARQLGKRIPNLAFEVCDLARLTRPSHSVDAFVCRYVLEHLAPKERERALAEMFRALKPGGELHAVDFDGMLYNLHPQTPFVRKMLSEFEAKEPIDLKVGRRIPALLVGGGYVAVTWRIEALCFRGKRLEEELGFLEERFKLAFGRLSAVLGGARRVSRFVKGYLSCLEKPGAALFYNKFIVSGRKPLSRNLKLIK